MTDTRDPLDAWTSQGYSEDDARVLVAWLAKEKRRLLNRARKRIGSAAETRNLPRHVRTVIQRKAKRFRKSHAHNLPKNILTSKYRDIPLLEGLCPGRKNNWLPVLRRPFPPPMPTVKFENFSFVHNPRGTMEMLAELIRLEGLFIQARLDFLDEGCLDIGPYLLLQAIRRHLAPVYLGGTMAPEIQHVIDAVGLRAALQMSPFKNVRDKAEVWPFRLRQRRPHNTSRSATLQEEPQSKEAVADQFIESVDEWLAVIAQLELTRDGRRLVQKMVGEALDNAERHSQPNSNDGDWAMTGYLVQRVDVVGAEAFQVHLAMLSIGSTVEESILAGPPEMLTRMDAYVARHQTRSQPNEVLRTVFALQDGVTKDKAAAAEGRGGTGFQDIFTFFADLGATNSPLHKAQLVIISGNTCIKLSDPYRCGVQEGGVPMTERELWFNPQNSPDFAPSQDHVFLLPHRLNGTLVSMVIPLDADYLKATTDD